MSTAPTLGPADRLAITIDLLCRVIAERSVKYRIAPPFATFLHNRLKRLAARFSALAAKVAANLGAGIRPRPARPSRASQEDDPPPRSQPRPLSFLVPRSFGWLIGVVPGSAVFGSQLRHLLGEPDTVALLAAAPQAARLLRPLCLMLGVDPQPPLPPPTVRRGRPEPPPREPARPEPAAPEPAAPEPAAPEPASLEWRPPPGRQPAAAADPPPRDRSAPAVAAGSGPAIPHPDAAPERD